MLISFPQNRYERRHGIEGRRCPWMPYSSSVPQETVFFATTPLANCPNVKCRPMSTSSPRFGCVNTASVFLATRPSLTLDLTPLTKCGTALNLPSVMRSSASPVWKAMQSRGILTCTVSPVRERMYRPASGSGDAVSSGRGGRDAPFRSTAVGTAVLVACSSMNIAEVSPVRQPWSR